MNTVAEIVEALPNLSDAELREVEKVLLQIYRKRKVGIVFDDSYGVLTELDLAAAHEETMRVIEGGKPQS